MICKLGIIISKSYNEATHLHSHEPFWAICTVNSTFFFLRQARPPNLRDDLDYLKSSTELKSMKTRNWENKPMMGGILQGTWNSKSEPTTKSLKNSWHWVQLCSKIIQENTTVKDLRTDSHRLHANGANRSTNRDDLFINLAVCLEFVFPSLHSNPLYGN